MRAITTWHAVDLTDMHINLIAGTERGEICVCSVQDHHSDDAARRVDRCGRAIPLNVDPADEILPAGLTLYGAHKWDRPTLDEFESIGLPHAAIAKRIRMALAKKPLV